LVMRLDESGEQVERLNTTEETYIETIDALSRKLGYAAVTDIAKELNVKSPSVTSMLKKLDAHGFVKYTPYRNVVLTQSGKDLAAFLRKRQKPLQAFLTMLGIKAEIAEEDACAIEHILHASTLDKLSKFFEYVQSTQGNGLIEGFKNYDKTKKTQ
jgi:DtxR family transcriptional regulator, Mn-dependent transcriptional regulator